ncbi:hypothetical protein NBRC110019_18280 [Neptunitalea chrysea]|uniref:Helicase ATP-binding domain-containing protein n=1 Tax=Neptunitalea chrysea TaxID=1647581 RepID=A0A9W6B528_9FLAO|nr:DEAD/DEAH box helicase family protein [Neptunitalea chrysea]GLB52788.1 hypothetical protein NBRC110019_18280 [Neptunitalea chrysea]
MNKHIESELFQNYPIEFKEINPEDFQYVFSPNGERVERNIYTIENNGKKIKISPDNEGYINDTFQNSIDINYKNTVVVNAAVGQGKSYAIIQTIKRYYEAQEDYLIIVASPFVSLVKQYCNDIINTGIPEEDVYNYENLGRDNDINYIGKPVQVVTVNTLLGNPGEDGFKNSDIKREYLDRLDRYCELRKIKVVFIYDEIHDSYHNFKQQYIFNLWKWKNVIHKNFILSATYNEASKVVIEYLAELTDFKIKIIESERKRFLEKQSSLYLHYSSSYSFSTNTPEIKDLIKSLVGEGKKIDILCYSKALSKSIINPKEEIGKLLLATYGEVKDCTSDLITNQRVGNEAPKNQYDNTMCNVGTNFKTGVSIKKENHAFVIVMPPRSARLWFKNTYGIFSGGINSVIQALARQRNKGEIHIVLPKPDKFEYNSLEYTNMTNSQKEKFINYYDQITYHEETEKPVTYIKLNRQDYFMREFYENKLKRNVIREINLVESSSRSELPILSYPTYDQFKLEVGEDYLANEYPIFGEDISAYITYAALANQFINCTLKEIKFKPIILIHEEDYQLVIRGAYNYFFGIDHYNTWLQFGNFNLFYSDVRKALFEDFQLKLKKLDGSLKNIKQGSSIAKKFEIQLLAFTFKMWIKKGQPSNDIDYNRRNYFLDCISHTENVHLDNAENESHKKRIELYQILNYFRKKLINSLHEHQWGEDHYFCTPTTLWNEFYDERDKSIFRKLLELQESDTLLSNNVFEFKRRFANKSFNAKLKTFYSILVEDFLEIENTGANDPKITLYGSRRNIKPIISIPLVPHKYLAIDLISPQSYNEVQLDKMFEPKIANLGLNI